VPASIVQKISNRLQAARHVCASVHATSSSRPILTQQHCKSNPLTAVQLAKAREEAAADDLSSWALNRPR